MDDAIKKALYQLGLRDKELVVKISKGLKQAEDQRRDVVLPNQNLGTPRLITTEAGHNQHIYGKSQQ